MSNIFGYYDRFRDVRGDIRGLPPWARAVFFVVALPGIALVALSIVALVASVVALFALTLPVYMLLRALTGTTGGGKTGEPRTGTPPGAVFPWLQGRSGARHVDVRVRDAASADAQAPDEVEGPDSPR